MSRGKESADRRLLSQAVLGASAVPGWVRRSRDGGDEGFTLIELLVVVIIIGILAAIAIPIFLRQRESAFRAAVQSDLRNSLTAEESFSTSNAGTYTTSIPNLVVEGFRPSNGVTITVTLANGGVCLAGVDSNISNGDGAPGSPLWMTNQGTDGARIMNTTPSGC